MSSKSDDGEVTDLATKSPPCKSSSPVMETDTSNSQVDKTKASRDSEESSSPTKLTSRQQSPVLATKSPSTTEETNTKNELEKQNTSSPRKNSDDDVTSPSKPSTKPITRQNLRVQEVNKQREKFLSLNLESKRKLYRNKYTTLKEITTWSQDHAYMLKTSPKSVQTVSSTDEARDVRDDLNNKISIFQGDITTLEIDAIANAANESLLGGGGVDGAIHKAAGPNLLAECETLNGCDAGYAKITCGYNLPAKYVIHTVGPRGEHPKVLRSCYIRCLELLKKHHLKTIAFPCISTGIFGYPNAKAANVVLKTLREWLEKDEYAVNVERIILCLFLKVDVDVYKKLLPVYFPVSDVNKNTNADCHDTSSPKKGNNNKEKEKENQEEATTKN